MVGHTAQVVPAGLQSKESGVVTVGVARTCGVVLGQLAPERQDDISSAWLTAHQFLTQQDVM